MQGVGAFGIGTLLATLMPESAGAQIDTTNRPVIVVDLKALDRNRDIAQQLAERAPVQRYPQNRAILALFGGGETYAFPTTTPLLGRFAAFVTLDDTHYEMGDEFHGIQSFMGGTFYSRSPLGHVTDAINVTMIHSDPAKATTEAAFISAGFADNYSGPPTLISGCKVDGYPYGADLFSNSTIRNCTISNISGGAFVRARGENVVIENNRSVRNAPLLRPGVVGAHIIVSIKGTNHTIRDNHFVADPVAWQPNVANAATGDMIALKDTDSFVVENNTIENSGEYGIVVSHGTRNGVITRNTIIGSDGCSIVVGADDVLDANGASTRARVHHIEVTDNHIIECGIDRGGDLGRSRATPNNTVLWNYPNALAGIRVTNADSVTIRRNSINQYRSSGIWVSSAFEDAAARARAEVTNLVIDETNSLEPYSGSDFDDTTWQQLARDDHAPWSGTSKLVDETGHPNGGTVFGLNVSRIIGFRDPRRNPLKAVLVTEEVHVSLTCLAGRGRVDVHLLNKSTQVAATYAVTVGGLEPRLRELGPLQAGRVTVTGRRDGSIRVTVLRDDEEIYHEVHTVACGQ